MHTFVLLTILYHLPYPILSPIFYVIGYLLSHLWGEGHATTDLWGSRKLLGYRCHSFPTHTVTGRPSGTLCRLGSLAMRWNSGYRSRGAWYPSHKHTQIKHTHTHKLLSYTHNIYTNSMVLLMLLLLHIYLRVLFSVSASEHWTFTMSVWLQPTAPLKGSAQRASGGTI